MFTRNSNFWGRIDEKQSGCHHNALLLIPFKYEFYGQELFSCFQSLLVVSAILGKRLKSRTMRLDSDLWIAPNQLKIEKTTITLSSNYF